MGKALICIWRGVVRENPYTVHSLSAYLSLFGTPREYSINVQSTHARVQRYNVAWVDLTTAKET